MFIISYHNNELFSKEECFNIFMSKITQIDKAKPFIIIVKIGKNKNDKIKMDFKRLQYLYCIAFHRH